MLLSAHRIPFDDCCQVPISRLIGMWLSGPEAVGRPVSGNLVDQELRKMTSWFLTDGKRMCMFPDRPVGVGSHEVPHRIRDFSKSRLLEVIQCR